MIDKNEVIDILQTCYDPEIPIDLWNLGLIYDIKINNQHIDILLTLTTPGCTMAQVIADDIKSKLLNSNKVKTANVEITFDPPWEPNMMTDIGKEKLGLKINKKEDQDENWE
tara:strand:+ start:160 stop:495 length:336 start_codon:yes stop_codon:yes gene_type:complete